MNLNCDPGFVSKLKACLGLVIPFLLLFVTASANGDSTLNKVILRAAPFANTAPVAVTDNVTAQTNMFATGNVLTNDSDPEGDALTASLVTAPVNGTIVMNSNGNFTYTPNANYNGTDSLIYQVCDNGTPSLCDTATLLIHIGNTPPSAVPDLTAVTEDIPATGNVLTNDTDAEGNALTASLVTAPVNGTVVLNADGSFTYTPNANYNGSDSLIYQVCDNGTPSLCDTATLLFNIAGVNDAPVALNDNVTVTEDVPATGNVLTNDFDPDDNTLTASLVTAPVNGTIVLNADGSFTYTPNANYHGADSLVYQMCDNGTPSLCDTAQVLFNITPVNDAPVAVQDVTAVTEDVPATGNVLTNDTDPEGDALTASLVTAPVNGTVVLNADGSFTYTPNANYNGSDSLIYQVCDNGTPSLCDTATLLFNIAGVNDAPVALNDNVTVTEDVPATGNVLTNDFDPDGNTLTASLVTAPVNGTIVLNADGSFTYTPNANYHGADSLVYQMCDNGTPSLCDTAQVLFNITPVNDAPVAVKDVTAVTEDVPATGNVLTNDTDPEGDALTASLVTAPVNGTVVLNANGSFTYTPNANYSGTDSLIYQVCDNGTPSLCDTATLLLNIAGVNHPPIAVDDNIALTEDVPVTGNVRNNDSDRETPTDSLLVSLLTSPVHGNVVLNNDGSFTYTPNANYSGIDSLIYKLCDPDNLCDTATAIFSIAAVNDAPVAVRDSISVTEDTPATGNVLTNDTDPEGDALAASLVTAPVNGTVVLNADGSFTYTPNANYNGADSLIYRVCDNGTPSLCDTAALLLNIAGVNDAPVAVNDNVAVTEDTPATGNVLTNDTDPEGNALTASLVTAPVNGTVVLNADGSFTYTPNANYSGSDSLIYQVCDNGTPSLCDTATLLLNISAVNHAPVAVNDSVAVTEDIPVTGNVRNNDSDRETPTDSLLVSLLTSPVHGTVVLNNDGSFTYTPNANYSGTDSLIYKLCDPDNLCDTATAIFSIAAANDAPVAVRDSIPVTEDTPATGNVLTNDTDPEGNALTASLVTAPVNGTVVLNADGSFTYTPNANYSGADSLIYQVCDNGTPSLCDTATLLLNISAVNHAPVAVNDSVAVTEDIPATGNVRNNDSDRETPTDSLLVSLLTSPVHGTVVLNNDGSFTYTPNANYSGIDSLIYKLCDPDNLCDTATAIFSIAAANDAPVAVRNSISVTEDTPATGNVLTNDTDPEGNALTASLVTAPVNGTVVLNADGSFTYTSNANYSGTDSLIYRVCDNGTPSLCDTAAVLFTVAAVNDSPMAVNDSLTTQQAVLLNGNVLLNDTDPENGTLTASVVTTTANGILTLQADGTFSYTSAAGFTGVDMATYKVCDPGGACDTALLVITVTAPPEAPVIGAAMSAVEPVLQPDGSSYRTTFTIKIKNYGNVRLQQVSAADNLAAAFNAPAGFRVVSAVATGGLVINNAFNGEANQQLLLAGSTLEAGETGTISLVLDIIPNGNFGPFNNSVTVTGTSPAGTVVSDISNNGAEADPNGNGSPSDNGEDRPTPVSPKANAVAGIAKTVSEPVLEINGDYTITYTLVVQNLGNVPVTDVQVTDDLSAVFAPPITYSLIGDIVATGGLLANNTFNGSNNIDLLAAGSKLAVGAGDTIRFVVRVTPNKQSGTFNNSAFLKGSGGGVAISDQSTNGLQADPDGNGIPDESVATPVTLNPTRLHIPGGFSPNGDGRNDRFVIGNAGNDKISLEMYNRWGSAVYKNSDYKNNWDGRSNQGLHPGDVVPDGTYYYIITVNGNDRIAGFITIMR